MDFSAPADFHGLPDVLTPEDAFVGALNMCFQLMFIWSVEKMRIELITYQCEAEGFVEEMLDRTTTFKKITLKPRIEVRNCGSEKIIRALKLAEKYSLIAASIRAEVLIEPEISVLE